MIPVDTILQVGASYTAIGFSCLYTSCFAGEPPQRKTFFYLRNTDGVVVDAIFKNAEVLY